MPSNFDKQSERGQPDATSKPAAGSPDADKRSTATDPPGPFLIDVLYADDGTPSVATDAFVVEEHTDAIWRGPLGDTRPFRIIFPTESPQDTTGMPSSPSGGLNIVEAGNASQGKPAPALILDSSAVEGRQTSKLRTKEARGKLTFDYTIEANGIAVDAVFRIAMISQAPAIVIEP